MSTVSEKNIFSEFTTADYLKFIVPSVLAFVIFLGPFTYNNQTGTILAWAIDSIRTLLGKPNRLPFAFVVINIGVILTLIANFTKTENFFLQRYMKTSLGWVCARVLGGVLVSMVFFNVGPEALLDAKTGKTMASMCTSIAITFFIGGSILPFLTDFGSLQFIGTLTRKFMVKLFRIPGIACIDCLVSWVGSSGLGMYYTARMHASGNYTNREAAVIVTNFSLVSLPYMYTMAEMVNLSGKVYEFILAAYSICVIIAMIMPRIWPLNRYLDINIHGAAIEREEDKDSDISVFSRAVAAGTNKAKTASVRNATIDGVLGGIGLCLGVVPIVMAFGTLALIVYEYSSILQTLSVPFAWLCGLAGIPEASAVGSAVLIGFVDQTLAAVVGSAMVSEAARFFSVIIATSGILYIAQPVPIILGSTIPLRIRDIIIIYVQRIILSIFLSIPFLKWFF